MGTSPHGKACNQCAHRQLLACCFLACVVPCQLAAASRVGPPNSGANVAGPKTAADGRQPGNSTELPPAARSTVAGIVASSGKRQKGPSAAPPLVPQQHGSAVAYACKKHPGLCQPATCEVWRPDVKNKCRYVRDKDACGADDQYIPYLEMFYCSSEGRLWLLISAFFVFWLLLLFYAMSVVADAFLCPAVQYISERLQLPPDIAGVTLLAFASGAPDIFTQVAAINGGNAVEVELAVASVMGSGLFICCISLAAVLFVQRIDITDRIAFIRDVTAYAVASAGTLFFLRDGQFARKEAIVLLVLYCVYLATCIYTSRGGTPVTPQHRHGALPSNSPRANSYFGRPCTAMELQPRRSSMLGISPLMSPDTPPRLGANGVADSSPQQLPARQHASSFTQQSTQSPQRVTQQFARAMSTPGRRPSSLNGQPGAVAHVSVLDGGAISPKVSRAAASMQRGSMSRRQPVERPPDICELPVSSSNCFAENGFDAEAVVSAANGSPLWVNTGAAAGNGMQHPTGQPSTPRVADGTTALRGMVWKLVASARAQLSKFLHFSDSWPMNCVVIATAPLVLLMHATMPAVDRGSASPRHCGMLSVAAPAFFLVVAGAAKLGLPVFALLWATSAAGLYFLMHLTFLKDCCSAASPPPKANAVLAVLAFVQSAVWLATIADEVVALLGAVGAMLAIEEDLLGATVLAWGETLPDLVAMLAVARAGQGTMAVAACFGGPVLNLLVGTAAPVLGASFKHGSLPFRLSNGITVLFLETVALCVVLLAVVPTKGNWGLSRRTGWMLLVAYGAFQLLFLAAQQRWLLPPLHPGA